MKRLAIAGFLIALLVLCLAHAAAQQRVQRRPRGRFFGVGNNANADKGEQEDKQEDPNKPEKKEPLLGIHLKTEKTTNLQWAVVDGKGFRWDIQRYGNVQYGQNYAYSGGVYLQIRGTNFYPQTNQAKFHEKNNEIELGPWTYSNLKIYRRVKVYPDRGMARWIDIFENPTKQAVSVPVRYYTNKYGSIEKRWSVSGDQKIDESDWAFATHSRARYGAAATLHIPFGRNAETKPKVNVSGNTIYYNYDLKIPAGGRVVLCTFESQDNSIDKLKETLETFRATELLSDLTPEARDMILNFSGAFIWGEIILQRRDNVDTVVLRSGKKLRGTLGVESLRIKTSFDGVLTLPARDIIGAKLSKDEGPAQVVLGDGQLIVGQLQDHALPFEPVDGNAREIKREDIQEFSFRVTEHRPIMISYNGPYLSLRSGDRLAFESKDLSLHLRTRIGEVMLKSHDVYAIAASGDTAGGHRVQLLNGTTISGLLSNDTLGVRLRVSGPVQFGRREVLGMLLAEEPEPNLFLTRVELTSGDVLMGVIDQKALQIGSTFGEMELSPRDIKTMDFVSDPLGRATVGTWNDSRFRGAMESETFEFRLTDDLTVDLPACLCVSLRRAQELPADEVTAEARKAIAKIRTAADVSAVEKELRKLGPGVIPLLEKARKASDDDEVRSRIKDLIGQLRPEQPQTLDAGGQEIIFVDPVRAIRR